MSHPKNRRGLILVVVAVIAALLSSSPAEAAAPLPMAWGVDGLDPASVTPQVRNHVWDIEQIGNKIYVGGKFLTVDNGAQTVSQRFLAAFDVDTGVWDSSFRPNLEGSVYALQASPDGTRLLVGGEFTNADGLPNTSGLVALDPATGRVDTSWKGFVERPWTQRPAVVYDLELGANHLYAVGKFSHVSRSDNSSRTRTASIGKFALGSGIPDSQFVADVTGGAVWGAGLDPDEGFLYLTGYFTSVNGSPGTANLAAINTSNGAVRTGVQPFVANHVVSYQHDVIVTSNKIFVAGSNHSLQVLERSTQRLLLQHTTGSNINGGDYQALERSGDVIYASCHCRVEHRTIGQGNLDGISHVAAYNANTGQRIDSFVTQTSGAAGVWALKADSNGCLWIGGDITASGGRKVGRFTRLCERESTNLAREGVVSQSSNYWPTVGASKAVDGSIEGTFTNLSVSSTLQQNNPWWQADLGSSQNISEIAIYNRSDCCPERLRNVFVFVSDSPFTSSDPNVVKNQPGVSTYMLPGARARVSFVNPNTSGRYVRIAQSGVSFLTMAEVVVLGADGQQPPVPDTERPTVPTQHQATVNQTTVQLSWNASTDNVGVVAYEIYRSTNGGAFSFLAETQSINYSDTDLQPNTGYRYYFRARDAAGNKSWRTGYRSVTIEDGGGVGQLPAPAFVNVTRTERRKVVINYAKVAGAANHEILVNGQLQATDNDSWYVVRNLEPGTTYQIEVRAIDGNGNPGASRLATVTTSP